MCCFKTFYIILTVYVCFGNAISCFRCAVEDPLESCEKPGQAYPCPNATDICITLLDDNNDLKIKKRGCGAEFSEEEMNICKDTSNQVCFMCNDNGCNGEELEHFKDCLSCDSDINKNCVWNPETFFTRRCSKLCATKLISVGHYYKTIRGCEDSCNDGSKCTTCKEEKCNHKNFPETRLSCNMCNMGDCKNPKPLLCPNWENEDACYTLFDDMGDVIDLGCRSSLDPLYVKYLNVAGNFIECNKNNCNTNQRPKSLSCIKCNSNDDELCTINPEEAATTNCDIGYCFDKLDGTRVVRGCGDELKIYERMQCNSGQSEACQTCNNNNCNNKVFPLNRLSCFTCPKSEEDCAAKPTERSSCHKYIPGDQCAFVMKPDTDQLQRGCKSDFKCDASEICHFCEGSDCNDNVQYTCIDCNSMLDPNCAVQPQFINKTTTCINKCYTQIIDDSTIRGCLPIDTECESENKCEKCTENLCNQNIFPEDRLQCYHCNSTANKNCISIASATEAKVCKKLTDVCISFLNNEIVFRGCAADFHISCEKETKTCKICKGELCNTDILETSSLPSGSNIFEYNLILLLFAVIITNSINLINFYK